MSVEDSANNFALILRTGGEPVPKKNISNFVTPKEVTKGDILEIILDGNNLKISDDIKIPNAIALSSGDEGDTISVSMAYDSATLKTLLSM